ncbi:MAG: enoyl-CoA hydratase [Alphaproteobacteria bacterium]|nr:enoyl-CoA hydratase [Alphaproteobacteria bacterium]
MTEELLYEVRGPIGHVTLNRPRARNALTFAMYEKLARICREIDPKGPVKVLIVKGAGDDAFAAGTDISQFREFNTPQQALDYEATIDSVLSDVEKCPVPIIAAITGACTGGGAGIAAACDLRICDKRLRYGFPIVRTLGNCLSIASLNRIASLIGAGRLREVLLTARLMGAEEAQAAGLISEVLEDADAVRARAEELAERLCGHAPLSMRACKEGLRRLRLEGEGAEGSDLVVSCYMSADFKEGIEAFFGKRKPEWKGE